MKTENHCDSILELPHLAGIFEQLRRGRHVCARDGELFHALKRQSGAYEALFARLGFKLVQHARDFFYFFDVTNFTDLSARMAVFMFILVESLSDNGEPVEETVLTRRFAFKDLPHLRGERRQTYMREAGITADEDLAALVRTMERFGFTRRMDAESFVFDVPVYRFLDICMEMASKASEAEPDAAASGTVEEMPL